eukprot:TRINITY_DN2160_c2_g1_i2.p1 TRINITY_DN2160_c2_g1~~TRINITY_DN2160_c2_g1_i2.p1  ORF type:complete len:259 (+),score=45.92 TRINITY_DN2160_c2_g1_i2:858-1634(+)
MQVDASSLDMNGIKESTTQLLNLISSQFLHNMNNLVSNYSSIIETTNDQLKNNKLFSSFLVPVLQESFKTSIFEDYIPLFQSFNDLYNSLIQLLKLNSGDNKEYLESVSAQLENISKTWEVSENIIHETKWHVVRSEIIRIPSSSIELANLPKDLRAYCYGLIDVEWIKRDDKIVDVPTTRKYVYIFSGHIAFVIQNFQMVKLDALEKLTPDTTFDDNEKSNTITVHTPKSTFKLLPYYHYKEWVDSVSLAIHDASHM